jgi:type I restriction enzyme S subunit
MRTDYAPLPSLLSCIIDNRGRTCPTSVAGIKLIATNCIHNDKLYPVYENVRHVSAETYGSWFRGHPLPGDIIFVNKGSPGRVCLVPQEIDFCIAQDMVALRADARKVNPKYLFAALRSDEVQKQIENMHVGTLIPHFKKGDFDRLLIPVPDRLIQDQIGEIYYNISLQIDLNRRMNETLEAMARALFKDWFVDFGPVRAKAEGRPPYLAHELWSLFPDALDDEDKPVGWRLGQLDDLIILQRGFDLPADQRTPGHYIVMAASGPNGTHNRFMVQGPGVTTGRSGVLGRVFYSHEDFWPLNTSLWVKEFRNSSPEHAYFLLQNIDFSSFNAGSAVPTLNRNHVHNLPFAVPDARIITAFSRYALPLLKRQRAGEVESNTLAQLRDFLLPKLMSGEIRLRDAEKAVEAAL